MSPVDYTELYDEYWSRDDRFGSHSFDDARALALSVIACCGSGRTLDVGCGMGLLVRTLVELGADAHGVDPAQRPIEAARIEAESSLGAGHAGRFTVASALDLPFADDAFDTIVSTDVLEHLDPADIQPALREIARVARRAVYLRIATEPDRDGRWHLTIRDGAWWREQAGIAGLEPLDAPGESIYEPAPQWHTTLVLQPASLGAPRIPVRHAGAIARLLVGALGPGACAVDPREQPLARSLRLLGVRVSPDASDASPEAWRLCSPGDTPDAQAIASWKCERIAIISPVAGEASGAWREAMRSAGYAAHPLGARTEARALHTTGGGATILLFERAGRTEQDPTDPDPLLPRLLWCVRQGDVIVDAGRAGEPPACDDPGVWADAMRRWSRAGDARTIDPGAIGSLPPRSVDILRIDAGDASILSGAALALRPGGRLLVRGGPETGFASSPVSQKAIGATGVFVLERGVALTDRGEPLVIRPSAPEPPAGSRWVMVYARTPVGETATAPRDPALPATPVDPAFHVGETSRDYDNGWLLRPIVSRGLRGPEARAITTMARGALELARDGSADQGAMLCVLAYRLLDAHAPDDELRAMTTRLVAFDTSVERTAHALRWRISCRYVRALLLLALGEREQAERAMLACATLDPLGFSPLLASKTVDALWHAGVIAMADGRHDDARRSWRRGLDEAERALRGDWLNLRGDPDEPMPFAFTDLGDVAQAADRCARALAAKDLWIDRPWVAWAHATGEAEETTPPRGERDALRAALAKARERLASLRDGISRLESARDHFRERCERSENRLERAESELSELRGRYESLKAHAERLRQGRDWHARRSERARRALESLGIDPDSPKAPSPMSQMSQESQVSQDEPQDQSPGGSA